MSTRFRLPLRFRFQAADFGNDLFSKPDLADLLVPDPIAENEPRRKRGKPAKLSPHSHPAMPKEPKDPREEFAPFPVHALPPALGRWVTEQAGAVRGAPEVAALAALAVSSAATLRRVAIDAGEGRREPAHLFVCILDGGRPGDSKVISAALQPLRDVEFADLNAWNRQQVVEKAGRDSERRKLKRLEKLAQKSGDLQELARLQAALAKLEAMKPRPAPRRVIDFPELKSLAVPLAALGHASIIEGRDNILGYLLRAKAAGEKLVTLLEAGHAGTPYVAELPRGRRQRVDQAAVACCTMLETQVAYQVSQQKQVPARGLLARFLYVAPAPRWGTFIDYLPLSAEAAAEFQATVYRLAALGPTELTLSPKAKSLHAAFQAELDAAMVDRGPLAPIRDWGSHLGGAALRLAGLLHLWTGSSELAISRESMAAAIEIARWLVPQAAYVFQQFGAADDNCTDDERTLLRFARAFGDFSIRDARKHLRKALVKASVLARAIKGLMRRGYLRGFFVELESPKKPRRALFEIVPRAIGLTAAAAPPGGERKRRRKE